MEFEKLYLYIFIILVLAFLGLTVVYSMYLVQQKVSNIAMTSADVAFFPVRATALVVRSFFRIIALCFDLTLFAARMFLLSIKLILTGLEYVLQVWRFPIVVMISILQKVRRIRKLETKKAKTEELEHTSRKGKANEIRTSGEDSEQNSHQNSDYKITSLIRGTLRKIRKVKKLLRPDLLAIQSVIDIKKYLRMKAGLENGAS